MRIKRLALTLIAVLLCISLSSCSLVINGVINGLTDSEEEDERSVETIVNILTELKMEAFVTIKSVFKKQDFLGTIHMVNTQSSGVVISYNGNIVVLTNNHSVTYGDGYYLEKVTVVDCYGNEHRAHIYKGRGFEASAPDLDLACLTVPSFSQDQTCLRVAAANPPVGDKVISVSTPAGQKNAISFGEITQYGKINVSGSSEFVSDVDINVINHTAKIRQGSSGGALLNYDLELVGIHFAGTVTEDNSFTNGYSIPVDSIMDFLTAYV